MPEAPALRAHGNRPPGRPHHRRLGHVIPARIPWLIPGEVFNKKIVDYLKFSGEFNAQCPGFENDIHGLVAEKDEDGKMRYYADCVRQVLAASKQKRLQWKLQALWFL